MRLAISDSRARNASSSGGECFNAGRAAIE
jgi:hypothetical protein